VSDIDLLLEAERRGILPDEKKPLLEEARRRGLVPGGEPEGGSEPDRALRRVRSQLTMGLADPILDRANALVRTVGGGTYDENLRKEKQLTAAALKSRDGMGMAGDVVSDTVGLTGQMIATAPLMAARTGKQLMEGGYRTAAELLEQSLNPASREAAIRTAQAAEMAGNQMTRRQIAAESTRVGGAFGAGAGYGQGDGSVEDVLGGAAGGAAIGRLIPGVMNQFDKRVAQPIRDRRAAAAAQADDVARTFDEAGLPIPGAHVLAGETPVGSVAENLSSTMFGSSIRKSTAESIAELEKRLGEEVSKAGGKRTPEAAGRETQDFLKTQLTERSIPAEKVKGMTPEQLQDISGVGPGPEWTPPPPRVDPVRPQATPVVTAESYLDDIAKGVKPVEPKPVTSVEITPPKLEDVPIPPNWAKAGREIEAEMTDATRQLEALTAGRQQAEERVAKALEDAGLQRVWREDGRSNGIIPEGSTVVMDKAGRWFYIDPDGKLHRKQGGLTLFEHTAISRAKALQEAPAMDAVPLQNQISHLKVQQDELMKMIDDHRAANVGKLADEQRAAALQKAELDARAEAERMTKAARDDAMERYRPIADREARHQTDKARLNAADEAARETQRLQAEAEAAQAAMVAQRKAEAESAKFKLGASKETYPTELDAAFAQTQRNTPRVQPGLLAPNTQTSKLVNELGLEARRTLQIQGYKDGDGLTPELLERLRPKIGNDLATALARYAEPGFKPDIRGLYDIRTMIGDRIGDAKAASRMPGQPRDYDEAVLKRLYDAVSDDITKFTRNAGSPGSPARASGELAARQHEEVREGYREFVKELRKPLSTVFGDKVTPEAAIAKLAKAASNDGDMTLLRAFYRVVDDKGDRLLATNAILHSMTEDGMKGFLKAYRGLSDDAKKLMFQGASAEYGRALDRLAKAGGYLERFARTATEPRASDLGGLGRVATQPFNAALGALAYFVHLPSAVTGAVGAEGLSRLLASKKFAEWLRTAPQAVAQNSSLTWKRHAARLRGIAVSELGLDQATADTLMEAVVGGKANAMFAGEKSQTAPRAGLERAKEMRGVSPEKIWKDTGWMRGKDGVWRYEIDDSSASLKIDPADIARKAPPLDAKSPPAAWRSQPTMKLGDILEHPTLFKAYPELRDMSVQLYNSPTDPADAEGSMRRAEQNDDGKPSIDIALLAGPTKRILSTVLHEAQHALEDIEGFEYGADKPYPSRPGEVQARNTERRRAMSDTQRRNAPPWATEEAKGKRDAR